MYLYKKKIKRNPFKNYIEHFETNEKVFTNNIQKMKIQSKILFPFFSIPFL